MKSQKLRLAILIFIGMLLTAAPVEAQVVANDGGFNPKLCCVIMSYPGLKVWEL